MARPDITLTVDTRQMVAALREQLRTSRHSAAFVINRHLFFIARRAYELTPIAMRQRILETFNVTQSERTVTRGRNAGKIRRKTNFSGLNRSAFRIMNWQRRRRGLPTLHGNEALRAARNMVSFRLRAIGSLRSGWIGAIIRMQRFLKESFYADIRTRVNRPGTAQPAREERSPTGEIAYRLTIRKQRQNEKIDPRVIRALQSAFDHEAADTWRQITARLQASANRINAK